MFGLSEHGAHARGAAVFRHVRAALRRPRVEAPSLLVEVLSSAQKRRFATLVGLWLTTVVGFWIWWCRGSHVVGWLGFVLNSAVLVWTFLLPGYFLFFAGRMKTPNANLVLPAGRRVAMVVTKAPSEPFDVVRRTLMGMLAQAYPHDTWLADEDPTPEVERWCRSHGVRISTRRGVASYHRSRWPRRRRCKEGNLAYFYDKYGYEGYDFVCQLDADHEPSMGYLEAMLRPFIDERVGYVSAPSLCDKNQAESWTARARLFSEAIMHGPLQAGYNAGFAPLCIGSHYAVRTSALMSVGGLGPELAEDHSTTLLLNAGGWRGVHALDAEAHGEGPRTFADGMTQEFQWARSLTVLMLTLTPRVWRHLPPRVLLQFVFSQLWYPLFAASMLLSFALPVLAIWTRTPWVRVSFSQFFLGSLLVNGALVLATLWLRNSGNLRPRRPKLLGWEVFAFQFARWPWVIGGILAGIDGAVRGKVWDFRVTPKGSAERGDLPIRFLLPPALLVLTSIAFTLGCEAGQAAGYYCFSTLNGFVYSAVLAVAIKNHDEDCPRRARTAQGHWGRIGRVALVAGLLLLSSLVLWRRGREAIDTLLPGAVGQPANFSPTLSEFQLGVYDPDELLELREEFALEHIFLSWATLDPHWLSDRLSGIVRRGRIPIVTVEPWPAPELEDDTLFEDIVAGRYDGVLDELAGALREAGTTVLVRWGHEMDNLAGPYPWIRDDPVAYVDAYRHVVARMRSRAENSVFVWSPAGNEGCEQYWPGDDYVDVVGLSILCFPNWELKTYGHIRSFDEMFSEKHARVERFHHVVLVAEFGVAGTDSLQREWLRSAFARFDAYPLLRSVVFYFSRDVDDAWGTDLPTPDWRFRLSILEEARQAQVKSDAE